MPEIRTVKYGHDAIIDAIMADPSVKQSDLARMFGYSQYWISVLVRSDAFKERLAQRKATVVDPLIADAVESRFLSIGVKDLLETTAAKSLEKIVERLENNAPVSNRELVEFAKIGVGDRNLTRETPKGNSLYVVVTPAPAKNTTEWVEMVAEAGK